MTHCSKWLIAGHREIDRNAIHFISMIERITQMHLFYLVTSWNRNDTTWKRPKVVRSHRIYGSIGLWIWVSVSQNDIFNALNFLRSKDKRFKVNIDWMPRCRWLFAFAIGPWPLFLQLRFFLAVARLVQTKKLGHSIRIGRNKEEISMKYATTKRECERWHGKKRR